MTMPLALSAALAVYVTLLSVGGVGELVDGRVEEGVAGGLGEVAVKVEGVVASDVFVSGIWYSRSPLVWPG